MSLSTNGSVELMSVGVVTTSGRGFNATELADMFTDKVVYVGDTAPPAIRDQARAFREQVRQVALGYITQAQKSERTTIINILRQSGQYEAADILEKL